MRAGRQLGRRGWLVFGFVAVLLALIVPASIWRSSQQSAKQATKIAAVKATGTCASGQATADQGTRVAAIARAHGALGFSVGREDEFEPALREAISSRQASVLHVAVDRAWLSVDEHPLQGG